MTLLRSAICALIFPALAACQPQVPAYDGPEVTRILVFKEDRKMYLMHHDKYISEHEIQLGFNPVGDKEVVGDGRTPEGTYRINRRNPRSQYYLSLGISYPDRRDMAEARARGVSPGGDIFIHGQPNKFSPDKEDWTWGCIAISNDEMRRVYAMVKDGTLISIFP